MKICGIDPLLAEDLFLREEKMRRLLLERGCDAALICTGANLVYATGQLFDGYYYLPAEREAIVFIRGNRPFPGEGIQCINRPEMIPPILRDMGCPSPTRLALEGTLPHRQYERLAQLFPNAHVFPDSPANGARMLKTPYEAEVLRRDGAKQARLYAKLPGLFSRGMTAQDFSIAADRLFRKAGHLVGHPTGDQGMETPTETVLMRDGEDIYPYSPQNLGQHTDYSPRISFSKIRPSTAIAVNIPGNFSGYHPSMRRCFYLDRLPQRAIDLHAICLEILRNIEALAVPGASLSCLYQKTQQIVTRYGAEESFLGGLYQSRRLGCGIGLQRNEAPCLTHGERGSLEAGMVLAIYPKMQLPGVGSLGVENTYIVNPSGLEKLQDCSEELTPFS